MATSVNDPPSPGLNDTSNGTPVDDSRLTTTPPSDLSTKTESPGHQGVNVSGGINPNLRVLECAQVLEHFNYKMIYEKLRSVGEIQRIKMVVNQNETAFNSYVTFSNSMEASSAFYYLRDNEQAFCKRCKIMSVTNLQDELCDFVPPAYVPAEELMERSLPTPIWHVASYKDGEENLIKGAESIQEIVGNIPRGNLKRYGKSILIKAGNKTQAVLLNKFKPSPDGNIKSVSPHKSFNTLKGVIYSRDLYAFSEREILKRCPSCVYKAEKLKNNHAILLTFCTDYIPDRINVEHSHIKVKKFHRRPTQCFKCFEYGHGSDNCRNTAKCSNCSGEHELVEDCCLVSHCFLCEGSHSPKSKNCPRFQFEQEVLEVANNQFISIGSAKQIVMGANKTPDSSYAKVIKTLKTTGFRSRQRESPITESTELPQAENTESPASNSPEAKSLPIAQNHPEGARPKYRKSSVPNGRQSPSKVSNLEKEKAKKANLSTRTEGSTSKKSSRQDNHDESTPSKRVKGHSSSESASKRVKGSSSDNVSEMEISNSFAALESLEGQPDKIVPDAPKPQRARSAESISAVSHQKESKNIPLSSQSHSSSRPSLPSGSKVKRLNFNNMQSQSPPKAHAAGKQAKS